MSNRLWLMMTPMIAPIRSTTITAMNAQIPRRGFNQPWQTWNATCKPADPRCGEPDGAACGDQTQEDDEAEQGSSTTPAIMLLSWSFTLLGFHPALDRRESLVIGCRALVSGMPSRRMRLWAPGARRNRW